MPVGILFGEIVLKIAAGFFALYAIMLLAPASMVFRNALGRTFRLWERSSTIKALGVAIFVLLFAFAFKIFQLTATIQG